MTQYTSLLQTVSGQLALQLSSSQLQRLTGVPEGPGARDALYRQRRDTVSQVREELSRMTDDARRQSEMIDRSENNLQQLRSVAVHQWRRKEIESGGAPVAYLESAKGGGRGSGGRKSPRS